MIFQSTLSVRRATVGFAELYKDEQQFQSTLSVRRATVFIISEVIKMYIISIHALREESDKNRVKLKIN